MVEGNVPNSPIPTTGLHLLKCPLIFRAQSAEGLTSDEKLQLRTEYDGTLDADDAEAERIRKQEYWALYTEEHRRGSGNTMNRG
jgi:hypothetical protein